MLKGVENQTFTFITLQLTVRFQEQIIMEVFFMDKKITKKTKNRVLKIFHRRNVSEPGGNAGSATLTFADEVALIH
jgi:hypothetical protein